MKKYLLSALGCCLALQAAALDPLGVYKVRPPQGCVDTDVTTQALSLPDLIQIGICTNPALSAQYMGVKAQEAGLGTSRSEYLPSITLSGNGHIAGERIEHGEWNQSEPYSGNAALNWLLFDFGGRGARIDRTKAYLEQANFTYNAALQDLVLSVQSAYLSLLAAQESLLSAKASYDTYKQSYNEAQTRYRLGMVSLSDKLQAQTTYEQAQLAVVRAENGVKQFSGALAVLLNMSPDTVIKLAKPALDNKFIQLEEDNIHTLMEIALAQRPEIKAQESAVKASKANLRTAKTRMLPTVSAVASASYNDNWKHSALYGTGNMAGLNITWPLFSGFSNMYQMQQASYQYKQGLDLAEQTERQVQNEVWSAYQNYKTSVRAYEISETVLKSAEENHRVAFRYYEVGKTDIINLLTAVAQLADARQNRITALYDLLLSKASLYRSIGRY